MSDVLSRLPAGIPENQMRKIREHLLKDGTLFREDRPTAVFHKSLLIYDVIGDLETPVWGGITRPAVKPIETEQTDIRCAICDTMLAMVLDSIVFNMKLVS
jgi:hypothetical protein